MGPRMHQQNRRWPRTGPSRSLDLGWNLCAATTAIAMAATTAVAANSSYYENGSDGQTSCDATPWPLQEGNSLAIGWTRVPQAPPSLPPVLIPILLYWGDPASLPELASCRSSPLSWDCSMRRHDTSCLQVAGAANQVRRPAMRTSSTLVCSSFWHGGQFVSLTLLIFSLVRRLPIRMGYAGSRKLITLFRLLVFGLFDIL